MIRASELVVGYRGQAILPAINLIVGRGEMVAIFGRNGCGKSTLVHSLLGLLKPISGFVDIDPDVSATLARQQQALTSYSPITTEDVLSWGRVRGNRYLGRVSNNEKDEMQVALEMADALHLRGRRFATLSDGERQRVWFARILYSNADLLVLDEPTAAMDKPTEQRVLEHLNFRREAGATVIVVTHFADLLSTVASRVLYLDRDCLKIVQGDFATVAKSENFLRHFGTIGVPSA